MQCSACRASVPDGARFCPSCGHSLVTASDERRVATVVFADLVGFTGLAEGRDPEQTKELVDRCFERLTAVIVGHGGRVDKVLGDGIIALFGAPVAHEDDPERAVRAALHMRAATGAYAAEIGVPLALRIGINTGEVLIGAMRAGGDTTAMGDAVNVASRLQTTAAPGQILVGPHTYRETRAAVRYEAIGPLSVRNRDEPVEAFAALEATVPPGQRARRTRTPFVGRDHELAMLTAAIHLGLVRCRPQLIVITGDAGVGKSRLAEEVATAAAPPGTQVFDSRCTPYGESNVWWPLAEALRQAIASASGSEPDPCELTPASLRSLLTTLFVDGDDTAPARGEELEAEISRTVDGLRYILGDPAALAEVDAAQARDEALRAAIAVLDGVTRHKPVVLGISELHWADDVILELIDRAISSLSGRPLVILTSARPELLDRWQPTGGRHGVVGLHLEPFSVGESATLLNAIFEGAATDELVDRLQARSGGNPLFLEELALLVRDTGFGGELPATLRGLVATRLDALPRPQRRLLDDASVVGRAGTVGALVELGAGDAGDVAIVLGELASQDLLDVDGPRWTFHSDVVREVAYGTLAKAERARRHARLAAWYGGQRDAALRDPDQLAFHAASAAELVEELGTVAGVPDDIRTVALSAIDQAAERALDREFSAEALRLYERGLALLDDSEKRLQRRFLAGRGRANTLLQRSEQARADLDASLRAARDTGDREAEAKALTSLGQLAQTEARFEDALALLDEALAVWQDIGDRVGEARVLRLQATLFLMTDRVAEAGTALATARRHFEDLGDRRGLAWAQQQLGWIAFTAGDLDTADVLLSEAAEAFSQMSDYAGLAWALGLQAWVRLQQGHLSEAERLAELVLARGETDSWATGMLRVLLASTRLWTGRTTEAIEMATEAVERFTVMGDRLAQLRAYGVQLRALVAGGRAREALTTIDRYRDMVKGEEDPALWWAKIIAVQILTAAGRSEQALEIAGDGSAASIGLTLLLAGRDTEALERLEADWATAAGPGAVPDAGSSYALALALAGRAPEARTIIETIDAVEGGTYHDRLLVELAAGVASIVAGDETAARARFDRAVEMSDATEDQMAQTVARLGRGHALGDEGDLRDARERLAAMGLRDNDWDRLFARSAAFSVR